MFAHPFVLDPAFMQSFNAYKWRVVALVVSVAIVVLFAVYAVYAAQSIASCERKHAPDTPSPDRGACKTDRSVALVVGLMLFFVIVFSVAVWSSRTKARIRMNYMWARGFVVGEPTPDVVIDDEAAFNIDNADPERGDANGTPPLLVSDEPE